MWPYASLQDYMTFRGISDPDMDYAAAEPALHQASERIDELTHGRIRLLGWDRLTAYQREQVTRAACYQARYIIEYGDMYEQPAGGYSLGDMSVTLQAGAGRGISKYAYNCLLRAGLVCDAL